jgi:2-polyprenyl-3-methyl-5-hydroxy-6-metoxy-1,4-benzoquinol methylase
MNSYRFEVAESMPVFWRVTNNPKVSPLENPKLPFEFDNANLPYLLSQASQPHLESTLAEIYRLDFNIGSAQEGHPLGSPYVRDVCGALSKELANRRGSWRVLEIGCGGGEILKYVNELGHETVGIDPSPVAARAGMVRSLDIRQVFFEETVDLENFDLVYAIDVLEHTADPAEFLKKAQDCLSVDGTLFIAVPNCNRSIRCGDISMAMHQHRSYFSDCSLAALLLQTGFSNVEVWTATYGGNIYATARKPSDAELTDSRLSRFQFESQKGLREISNFFASVEGRTRVIAKFLRVDHSGQSRKGKHAIYAPLRAVPYLFADGKLPDPERYRFLDDTPDWSNKYFDGIDIPIERCNYIDAQDIESASVMSLTFETVMVNNLKSVGIPRSKISTLSEYLA